MRSHLTTLLPRMIRAGLRLHACRYRVIAVGVDRKDRIINIKTNIPRLPTRGWHAEERIIYQSPKGLSAIYILRIGSRGEILPIDPCENCKKLAMKRGIKIERMRIIL